MQKFLKYLLAFLLFTLMGLNVFSQTDSTKHHINERLKKIEEELKKNPNLRKDYEDLTFYYSQMFKNRSDSQKTDGVKISGYIDAYMAHYSDDLPIGTYQKFPTSAPISNTFSLNLAQMSMRYQNDVIRAVATVHGGDIAACAWSNKFNFIQEANGGMRLFKNMWLDAGFFRTHLGFESIQPRENIGSSIALTTYYEPYYLSGAKLTYYATKKLSLQINAFNGFNTFVAINSKKTYGFTAVYEANPNLLLTYNVLFSDNSADSLKYTQRRLYQNFYVAYKSKHWDIGFEMNYGIQENTALKDSTKQASMYSMLLAGKYKIGKGKFAVYGRAELFRDKDEILTGPVINEHHTLVGLHAIGGTLGLEYKPVNNSFIRLESRYIHLWNDENIFYTRDKFTNVRLELIATLGVWF